MSTDFDNIQIRRNAYLRSGRPLPVQSFPHERFALQSAVYLKPFFHDQSQHHSFRKEML
jgi:hypothetical protein